jgi:hypothetical protein
MIRIQSNSRFLYWIGSIRSIFAASTFGQASILEKMGWDLDCDWFIQFFFFFVAKRNGRPLAPCFFVAARNLFYCESFSYRQSKSWSGATKNTRYFYQRNNNIKSH